MNPPLNAIQSQTARFTIFKRLLLGLLGAGVMSASAHANLLLNSNFDTVGASGSLVTTSGVSNSSSAADSWFQYTVVPAGYLTTELLTSTDPFGGGNMLHVTTDSGVWPGVTSAGNGFAQLFSLPPAVGRQVLANATLSFDIDVVSGSVTGALTNIIGDGFIDIANNTFGPTAGWVHITEHAPVGVLADGVAFETLTRGQGAGFGANYYVDNLAVTSSAVPVPASLALIFAGLAGLGRFRRGFPNRA